MASRLVIREKLTGPWVQNFSAMGWKVRNGNNSGWIQLHPGNTKVRNASNTAWVSVK